MKLKIRWFSLMLIVFGIYLLQAIPHELVHMYQFGFNNSEACFSVENFPDYVFYAKQLEPDANWKDGYHVEFQAYMVSMIIILTCLVYVWKNMDILVKEK